MTDSVDHPAAKAFLSDIVNTFAPGLPDAVEALANQTGRPVTITFTARPGEDGNINLLMDQKIVIEGEAE